MDKMLDKTLHTLSKIYFFAIYIPCIFVSHKKRPRLNFAGQGAEIDFESNKEIRQFRYYWKEKIARETVGDAYSCLEISCQYYIH